MVPAVRAVFFCDDFPSRAIHSRATLEQPSGKHGAWRGNSVVWEKLEPKPGEREVNDCEQSSPGVHHCQPSHPGRHPGRQHLGNLHHQQQGD